MQQDNELDAIFTRIQALLTITPDRGASLAEAQTAAALAQKLMTRYNLDRLQVEAKAQKNDSEYVLEHGESGTGSGLGKTQRVTLMTHVCKYNFCRSIYTDVREHQATQQQKGKKAKANAAKFDIIGTPANVKISKYLYGYLTQIITMVAKKEFEEIGRYSGISHQSWYKAFYAGAITNIIRRLAQQFEESQRQYTSDTGSSCTALIVLSDQAVNTAIRQLMPNAKLKSHTSRHVFQTKQASVYNAGYMAADQIPLKTALEEGKETSMIS